jgi:hypothetical protein
VLILVNREDERLPDLDPDELQKHRQVVAVLTDSAGEIVVRMVKDNIGRTEIKDVTP